jgi:NADH:flavin oxidoreductase / NADH oxidase family
MTGIFNTWVRCRSRAPALSLSSRRRSNRLAASLTAVSGFIPMRTSRRWRVVDFCRRAGSAALGIQLAHAGRNSSPRLPWQGGGPLPPDAGTWTTAAPSAIPFDNRWPAPQALDEAGLARIRDAHAAAARRAERLGVDLVELLGAHGFLLHSFLPRPPTSEPTRCDDGPQPVTDLGRPAKGVHDLARQPISAKSGRAA